MDTMDPTNRGASSCSGASAARPFPGSGGEGSTIWKSTDGGDTWQDITMADGLPEGTRGISGISVSAADPDVVYAMIESDGGGVFRSDDAGASWRRVNSERKLRQRAWYYSRLQADPADVDRLWVMNVGFHRSDDGGKTFERVSTPHSDNHDLWISADDPMRMIEGNDGGANVSRDGGKSWSEQSNQPTSQMYRVSTDNAFPYRVLGGQQDNSAVRVRSRSLRRGSIGEDDWESTAGGESGHIAAHPADPDVVFGSSYGSYLSMVNHPGQFRNVTVYPTTRSATAPRDGTASGGLPAVLLALRRPRRAPRFGGEHTLTRRPTCSSARPISARAGRRSASTTRNDPTRLGPSGGPITKDNTSVEYYCTIFAAFESPLQKGVIWAGSDDGRVHVTWDDGASWEDVTPEALPEWTQINDLVADPFTSGGAYLAGTRYKLDDFRPYLFHTTDFGATWRDISAGLPEDEFTRAIAADS